MEAAIITEKLKKYFTNYLIKLVIVFICYWLLAELSTKIDIFSELKVQIWCSAGFAMAVMILWGYSVWPAVFLGSLMVHYLNTHSLEQNLGVDFGNTIGPFIAAYICRRSDNFHTSLDRFKDVWIMTLGSVLGALAGTLFGVDEVFEATFVKINVPYFVEYWAGNLSGILMTAPVILVFSSTSLISNFQWKNFKLMDRIILGLFSLGVLIIFSTFNGPVRLYFFFPFIFWISFKLGQKGVTLASLVLSIVIIYLTVNGIGPFSNPNSKVELELYLLIFLATLQITGLFIAGVLGEREYQNLLREQSLMKSNSELEVAMKDLKVAKEAAEASSAAKTAFLANVSHEIRTPLGAIMGFSDIVLTNNMNKDERSKIYEIIKRNGLQLLNVINDILDLSKIEAGKFEMQKRAVSIDEIIEDINSTMTTEAEKKKISLKIKREANLPKKIFTDPLRLRQILLNIIGNAIKFTDHGSVDVKVNTIIDSNGLTKIAFVVQDTGIGIPSDKVKDLFAPFTQVDFSSTRRFGGTGLGLALSQRLATSLGGGIYLNKTTLGQGSEFVVTIDPGDAIQIERSERKLQSQLGELSEKNINNKLILNRKILLVDDSPDNQSLFSYYIRSVKGEVEIANNGNEAIEKVHSGKFDIILMDLQMPEMDGYEATRILRNEGYKKPIIALSAHAMKEVREKCLASGFDDYISKPVERASLIKILSKYSSDSESKLSQMQL